VEALHEVGGILLTSKYTKLANRIQAHGIAPPAWNGMNLRDYFAAKAMAALINTLPSGLAEGEMKAQGFGYGEVDAFIAKCAYDYADAMLKERNK
jgi:hypothetical protein